MHNDLPHHLYGEKIYKIDHTHSSIYFLYSFIHSLYKLGLLPSFTAFIKNMFSEFQRDILISHYFFYLFFELFKFLSIFNFIHKKL